MTTPTIEYDRNPVERVRHYFETILLDVRTVSVPQDPVVEVPLSALERLIARSAQPDGFDREILLNLDAEAWGTSE